MMSLGSKFKLSVLLDESEGDICGQRERSIPVLHIAIRRIPTNRKEDVMDRSIPHPAH